jgi:cell division protease FtsH
LRRFFKSAAFPILLVVILAFVAQRVFVNGPSSSPPTYNQFLAQIEHGQVKSVTINTKDNTLDITETDNSHYSTGYPSNTEQSLVNSLQRNHVETSVKGTGGSSLLSILTYILPFVLFFGFWIFLMNQMQGDQGVPREPEEVPGARCPHPQGRAALRAAGHR